MTQETPRQPAEKNLMSESLVVPIKHVKVRPGRGRKEFGKVQELADSIKRNGLLNPIFVEEDSENPGFYYVAAGERRWRACILAGLTQVRVTFMKNLTDLDLKIAELEENVQRLDLDWQEEAELNRQIDELQRKKDPNWTQKDTAQLTQLSPAMISRQINIAKELKENPKLKEKVKGLDFNAADKVIKQQKQIDRVERLQAQGKLKVTTDLRLGDCTQLIRDLGDGTVDLLIMDPPYGLEKLEAMRDSDGSVSPGYAMMSEHHNSDIETVIPMLKKLAPELARVLKPGAHFYCFCAFQYIGDFVEALKPLEFQPPVVLWIRERNTTLGSNGHAYLSAAEVCIYGCNPPRSKRLAKNMYNTIKSPEVPKNERCYPTEKPLELLETFINQSSIPGDLVLDCFAGSGSTLKAARKLARRSVGFEINRESWLLAQAKLGGDTTLFDEESAA